MQTDVMEFVVLVAVMAVYLAAMMIYNNKKPKEE